ncbi:MAG: MFS transporter [Anaerovorax sp.]
MNKTKISKDQTAILMVSIVTAFITTFTGSAMNLAIPTIGHEFQTSAALLGWIVTAYMLTAATLSVPFGRLADIRGRHKVLTVGIFIFMLASFLSAFTWSLPAMILCRLLQGFGGAMIFSTNTAILISSFSPDKKGKVLGYSIASTYVGLTAGPVVGGLLNHSLGWRSIFIFTGIIGLIIFIIAVKKLPKETSIPMDMPMDTLGNLLYIFMIALIMYGLSSFTTSVLSKCAVGMGLLLSVFFVRHELKTQAPIIQITLFTKNPAYALSNLAALMNYGATFALGYLLSIYLQSVLGFNSQIAGLILISQPLIMAVLSPYAGHLSDRFFPFKLASMGMGASALGLLFFVFINESTPLFLIVPVLMFIGAGFAFFSSPNTNAVMSCVHQKDYGVASSILATMRSMGHTFSMVIVTLVVSTQMGNAPLSSATPAQLIATMRLSFIIFTVICIIGIFFSAKRKTKA